MIRILLISVILFGDVSCFVMHNRCNLYVDDSTLRTVSWVDKSSMLFQAKGRGEVPHLIRRLIGNATTIRENIVDTFSCDGRVYGYYADQDNDCQIFHICLPMQQLYPHMYCEDDIYHFSFICPKNTIFDQEARVCGWINDSFPCSEADQLYDQNNLFFVVPEDVQKESSVPYTTTPAPVKPCCSNRKTTPSQAPRRWRTDIATNEQDPASPSSVHSTEVDQSPQESRRRPSILTVSSTEREQDTTEPATTFQPKNYFRDTLPLHPITITHGSGPSNGEESFTGSVSVQKQYELSPNRLFESQANGTSNNKEQHVSVPGTSYDTEYSTTLLPSEVNVIEESQTFPRAEDLQTSIPNDLQDNKESHTTFPSYEIFREDDSFDPYQPTFKEHIEPASVYSASESISNLDEVATEPATTEYFWNITPRTRVDILVPSEAQTHSTLKKMAISNSVYSTSESNSIKDEVATESDVTESVWNIVPMAQSDSSSKSISGSSQEQDEPEKVPSSSFKDSQSNHRSIEKEASPRHALPPLVVYSKNNGKFYGFHAWAMSHNGELGNSFRRNIRSN